MKSLQELEALKNRLEIDIKRSRLIDADGLSKHSPLLKNFEQCQKDIANFKDDKNE